MQGQPLPDPQQARRFSFAGAKVLIHQTFDGRVSLFYRDTRGQMLLLEEPAKPGALHLCEEDRQLRLAIGPGEARDDNLLA